MNNKTYLFIGIIVVLVAFLIDGNIFWLSAIGLGLTGSLLYLFIDRLGKSFPMLELILVLASLQWIVGPFQDYRLDENHFKYFMYVDEPTYMALAVPAMLVFTFGVLYWVRRISYTHFLDNLEKHLSKLNPQISYLLIVVGFVAGYLQNRVPGGLAFIFFLLSNLRYVGAAYVLYGSKGKSRWYIFWGVLALTFVSSVQAGLFHEFFLWSVFLFAIAALRMKPSIFTKVLIAGLGIYTAFIVQSVKSDYRAIIWKGKFTGSQSELFFDLVLGKIGGETREKEELNEVNVRFNQGWIISAIMKNMPAREPFAEGETVREAVFASILPRFLNPDKKQAGGRENFERFTGLKLEKNTSMGTSILGEAYANYGTQGAYLFMFIWGSFLALYWSKLAKLVNDHPTLILWFPILFLQVVKAETELVVVLNHLVKASILVFGIFWLSRNFFRISL